ncbi:MAG TPA: isoprenylcysteine carboxylmethyltransferase family protein [Planctomycetota bacterium]|nr:isoprenylcysteine carboxylmethyltransferase family protein [Planctomycetota bacterium]
MLQIRPVLGPRVRRLVWTFFWLRNVLAGAPLVYACMSTRWEVENEPIVWSSAVAVCAAGIALRTWAYRHNSYGQTGERRLATTGPYAYVRNPLYIGTIFILAGAGIASELLWFVPAIVGWAFFVYGLVGKYEETRLAARYGEPFLLYRERVPAWIPSFRHVKAEAARATGALAGLAYREILQAWVLLPFVAKEMNVLGLGHAD